MLILLGRVIGAFLLCVFIGLVLERVGVTPHAIFHDTWRTIDLVFNKFGTLVGWSLPYAMLGGIIVIPLLLLAHFRHPRRRP